MLVLIDESGDAGFKFNKGSSPFFVASMVIFSDMAEAEKCSAAIQKLQKDYRIYPEFKFSNCRAEVKDKFFNCIQPFDFSIYALAVPKTSIYSSALRKDCDKFYNFFIRQLLSYHENLLHDARIKIDESGDRLFKKGLETYIRRMVKPGCIRSIKFQPSKNDHLIQMADMVTGAIARSYSSKKDNARWHGMLAPKIGNLWKFR